MLKKLFAVALLITCGLAVFGQVKPRIGILPFTGGQAGDGETISTLLSFQGDIMNAFTVVPMTNAVTAQVMDQNFQLSGFPDSDTIVRLGRMLNVDFVVSGYIRRMDTRSLVITNVINVNTFEMPAGNHQEYRGREEIPGLLPDMARSVISGARRDTFSLPRMTIAPFNIAQSGVNVQEVESLAQILAIDIANSGRYSVLPRTTAIQAAKREFDYQTRGYSSPGDEARALGRSVNARYILNTEVHGTGSAKMLTASIYDTESGSLAAEGSRNYFAMNDGVPLMSELAWQLSPGLRPAAPVAAAPAPAPQPIPAPRPPAPAPQVIPQPAPQPIPQPVPQPQPAPQPAPAPVLIPRPSEPIRVQPAEPIRVQPEQPEIEPEEYKEPEAAAPVKTSWFKDPARLWTIGVSVGSSFAPPWLIATVHGTVAPVKYMFIELGCDFGFVSMSDEVEFYYSIYPFAHVAFFMPFSNLKFLPTNKGGFYVGAGAGYMMPYYRFAEGDTRDISDVNVFAIDAIAGFNLFNFLDVSYTLRAKPDFKGVSNKFSIGYVYRF